MIACGECKKTFASPVGLAIHVGTEHHGVNVCPHCGTSFGKKQDEYLACIHSHEHDREAKQA